MNLLKMCGPQILLCLFTFGPIASKQLNTIGIHYALRRDHNPG